MYWTRSVEATWSMKYLSHMFIDHTSHINDKLNEIDTLKNQNIRYRNFSPKSLLVVQWYKLNLREKHNGGFESRKGQLKTIKVLLPRYKITIKKKTTFSTIKNLIYSLFDYYDFFKWKIFHFLFIEKPVKI